MKSALMAGLQSRGLDDSHLSQYAAQRYRDMKRAMEGSEWWTKRERYERMAASDYCDRLSADPQKQSIFDRKNHSLQLIRSVCKFLLARTWKDLFGSAPWFAAKPKPQDGSDPLSGVSPEIADKIQPHAEAKLNDANYKGFGKEAISTALNLGEAILKTTWRVDSDVSERLAMILWDSATRKPVLTSTGDYIYADDESEDPPGEVEPMESEESGPEAETPEESTPADLASEPEATTPPPPAGRVFTKAPEVQWKKTFKWKEHLIEETVPIYTGLSVSVCRWKDVFWEINKSSLDESDFVHVYDSTLSALTRQYNPDGKNADVQAALDLLRHESTNPKAEAGLPKLSIGEPGVMRSDVHDPVVKIGEFYLDCDVFKDGSLRRLHIVMALDLELIIWAEYRSAMSPLASKPVHMLPVNRVPGRAYGRGMYEMFEQAARVMDELLNSIMWRNSYNSDPLKLWNPHKTEEGSADPHMRFEPGKTYTVKGQANPAEILTLIPIPDVDDRTWELMQLFMQLVQVESGVTNQAQASVSQLEISKTATATNALTEVSSVLHLFVVEELRDGFTPQLKYAVELVYFRQDSDDAYESGADGKKVFALAEAQQLSGVPMQVDIVLTRVKRQEMREAAVAAIPIVDAYYDKLALVPEFQASAAKWKVDKTQPLYVQVLRGFEIDNADDYFPSEEEMQGAIASAQQAMLAQSQMQQGAMGAPPAGEQMPSNVIPGPQQEETREAPEGEAGIIPNLPAA